MNSFGQKLKVTIYGESHGHMVGVGIDGVPPGIDLQEEDMLADLQRRKPGRKGTTPRIESDLPTIMAGTFNGKTTGAPVFIQFQNNNTRSKDYSHLINTPRPGHADFVANKKFNGFNDYRGGGHFSGRLTLALVSAGVLAKKVLGDQVKVKAQLIEAGGSRDIDGAIDEALEAGDSIGGIVECRVQGLPVGHGEPFFDSVESCLAHMVFAIPATKGVEFGSGFGAARMKGSEHNDVWVSEEGKTKTNNAGGINGGITNGNELVFRVAIKPTSSIGKPQTTMNMATGQMTELEVRGRHDACIALRVPVVLENATAIVLADLMMRAPR